VLSAEIQRLEIYNSSPTAPIGYPRQFAVNGVSEGGIKTDVTLSAVWSSSAPEIATVSASGRVMGVAVGTSVISASYAGQSVGVQISVTSIPLVSTIAGSGREGFTDGFGRSADFNRPLGMTFVKPNLLYVTEWGNCAVRQVNIETLEVRTIAGAPTRCGFADGDGSTAQFGHNLYVAADQSGNLYVSDWFSVRKITFSGQTAVVSTLAGTDRCGYRNSALDATGSIGVEFCGIGGIATDADGNIFVNDRGNFSIRKIAPDGTTSTLAGAGFSGFADGLGAEARFRGDSHGNSLTVDPFGDIYMDEGSIRKITQRGLVTTFGAGSGSLALTTTPSGKLIVSGVCGISTYDYRLDNSPSLLIGYAGCGTLDGPANEAGVTWLGARGLAHDGNQTLYFIDHNLHVIRSISPVP
jgi:hypothetical protein